MSKKRSKRNTKASLKALQAKRKTYSKGSRVKKAPGGFSMTPEMLEAIQANPSGTRGGPSAGIDPAIAGRVYGQNKEKQPVDTGTVKTPNPIQTAEASMPYGVTPEIRANLQQAQYGRRAAPFRGITPQESKPAIGMREPTDKEKSLLASATPSTGISFSSQGAIDAKAQDKLANENYFKNLPEIEKRRKSPEFLTLENKISTMADKLGSKAYEDIEFRLLTRKLGRMAGVDDNGNLFPAESEAQARAAIAASDKERAQKEEPLGTGDTGTEITTTTSTGGVDRVEGKKRSDISDEERAANPKPVITDEKYQTGRGYAGVNIPDYGLFNTDLASWNSKYGTDPSKDQRIVGGDGDVGITSDAPTDINLVSPSLTEDQVAAQTRTLTKTALGQKSSADIDALKVAAVYGGTSEERRRARETLQSLGLSTNVEKLDNADETRPSATAGNIGDTDSITQTQGTATVGSLQNKFTQDEAGNALANTYTADTATAASMTAAQGELSPGSTAEAARADFTDANKVDTATRDSAQEQAALAQNAQFREDSRSQVGEVSFREDVTVSPTPEAEAKTRAGIVDDHYAEREANQIIDKIGFVAAQRRTVTGEAAKGAAATMLAQVGELPPEITAAIVEDPATVTAKVDNEPVEVQAAIAALPTEALVSSQMETLLAGMDDGNTPAWARPAVAQVEAMLAQRGLSASTVARDSLFNAIVQTALPMAQSNAQALQTRAAQNLSNEQQANMSAATLDAQRRLANLSNEQTAESQTAQMAQQMSTMQSQFRQDAVMTSEQIAQQTRVQNLANQQEAAKIDAANQQQINAQELGNAQQIELAEMQYQNATNSENMSAEQQQRLTDFQVAADFLAKNTGFKQQMDLANMSNEQQTRLANLTALNAADTDNLSAAQQTELANLNTKMQTNLTQAKIAESMGVAQLSVDQQRAITNASTIAKIDLTKFSTEQQVELANSQFMQTATLTDYSARQQSAIQNATTLAQMDMQAADLQTKTRISNAQNFLQMDLANLSNRQQEQVLNAQMEQQTALSNQAASNASKQFNAASQNQVDTFMTGQANQMEQFNKQQSNAMSQFNASEANKISAQEAGNQLQADLAQAQLDTDVSKFNAQIENSRDQWNAANAQAVEQSNANWRRQSNTIDTAAANAANQQNVQTAFNVSSQEQTQLWQQLRDEANYIRQSYENEEQRKAQLYATAIGNETGTYGKNSTTLNSLINAIT